MAKNKNDTPQKMEETEVPGAQENAPVEAGADMPESENAPVEAGADMPESQNAAADTLNLPAREPDSPRLVAEDRLWSIRSFANHIAMAAMGNPEIRVMLKGLPFDPSKREELSAGAYLARQSYSFAVDFVDELERTHEDARAKLAV
jgi:hypothetical protein